MCDLVEAIQPGGVMRSPGTEQIAEKGQAMHRRQATEDYWVGLGGIK
jgi:hypothetical protein